MDLTQPDPRAARAAAFERQRPYLRSVGYRMLGSLAEADDALQECWLRLDRSGPAREEDLRPWLTTVLGRICLDMLRSRRSRKEQYAGSWLPEPLVADASPEAASVQADSVGLALLIVLETLRPAERLAFVLHEVFGLPFAEIAPIVGRSPTATRQLASRARRRVRAAKPEPEADLAVERRVVDAFLAAARSGDFAGLLAVLDPDVLLQTDGGGRGPLDRPPVTGAPEVARRLLARASSFAPFCRPATVNGRAGFVVGPPGRILGVVGFRVAGGRITEVDIIGDPSKLGGVTIG
ncbi:MAG: sigma-70 family RNA polymerase sigma factor [Chloroflexota bacterium]|nr:MAG: sigma-70 family RNA polymerase sigma factor [Chloroflexota bacterium]